MAFRGWPEEALDFYEGLEADNSKTYWLANKSTYDEKVYAPMAALVAELEPEFGPGKIFRPYRDVRFSADKSPYKTHIAASLERGYVQLDAGGLSAGTGMYMMAPDQLARYRQAVDAQSTGTQLQEIVAALARAKIEVIGHETLKRVPRGYPADHPRAELLRYKGIVAWKRWPVASWLGKPAAKTKVVEFLRTASPLNDWLERYVGPSMQPPS
ncbi:MAG TPA: DUF2461 domain-containing protein [Micromonosporaceae bacterium]|nr:DUF2461 domain-containing protein [Micromonosporaceae bacterium]